MAIIETTVEISKTPAEVRAIVLDFEQMPKWHTSFLKVLKPLPEGTAPVDMKAGSDMFLKFLYTSVTCKCAANDESELAWEGGPGMLFHGRHSIKFEGIDGGARTLVRHGEKFTGLFGEGVALPGIKGGVKGLYEGFNRDLKRRCEEGK